MGVKPLDAESLTEFLTAIVEIAEVYEPAEFGVALGRIQGIADVNIQHLLHDGNSIIIPDVK